MCTNDVSTCPKSAPNKDPKRLFLLVGGAGFECGDVLELQFGLSSSMETHVSPSASSFERIDFGRGDLRILRRTGGDFFGL